MLKYEGFVANYFCLAHYGRRWIIPRSLKTTGNKNCLKHRLKFFLFFKIIYDPFTFAKNSFSKIPVTVTGMVLCVDLGPKCHNLFCLV
jgi:hypothetical protein